MSFLVVASACLIVASGFLTNVTFVNELSDSDCSLFWHGYRGNGPRQVYGPLAARGGEKLIEATVGHVFSLTRAGALEPLVEYEISAGVYRYSVTDADAAAALADMRADVADAAAPTRMTTACRQVPTCTECLKLDGCGWSVVRHRCFKSHPIATENSACNEEPVAASHSAEEWLQLAVSLMDPKSSSYGPSALRAAYRKLERGAAVADNAKTAASIAAVREELAPKLEAIFDEVDAEELLAATRHAALKEVHSSMQIVARRKLADAVRYIARGEPVVITNLFEHNGSRSDQDAAAAYPVSHKWTLTYLNHHLSKFAYSDKEPVVFNIAADAGGACCQYYDLRRAAIQAGYPYPFRPRTHVYRDTFSGFVTTLRSTARNRTRTADLAGKAEKPVSTLHYLHETVLEGGTGQPRIAGEAAPPQLATDLVAATSALNSVARLQAFFAGIANAKLWIGQRGVILPLHYDATDNLYVMAWGRKRAVLGEPGQLDALYRYPNAHPHVGSAQVNISSPNLTRHPRFARARLREVVVGPGDVLYLPAFWWHQFEQPFEDTASLNLWSGELPAAEGTAAIERDARKRAVFLYDNLEYAVVNRFGNKAGILLGALARDAVDTARGSPKRMKKLADVNETLLSMADRLREWALVAPGAKAEHVPPPAQLVAEFLELSHRDVVKDSRWSGWKPGDEWDMSKLALLDPELRARCKAAPRTATFASVCQHVPPGEQEQHDMSHPRAEL